ncbi:MAG TPA: hypothetical protein VEC96_00405 [Anaerolineae bacterium]|nr:hypothetical protein [Anaerolineae bacterium]
MNRHPTVLMLSLIGLLLGVIGLGHLQKVWKYALVIAGVAGVVIGWLIYFDLLLQSL